MLIKPFYTRFCLETSEYWRFYSDSYDGHKELCQPYVVDPVTWEKQTLFWKEAKDRETHLEIINKLPAGYLQGTSDIYPDFKTLEAFALMENVRLSQWSPSRQTVPRPHVDFVLTYLLKTDSPVMTTMIGEVNYELRTFCHCASCVPLPAIPPFPPNHVQLLQYTFNKRIVPLIRGKSGSPVAPPIVNNPTSSAVGPPMINPVRPIVRSPMAPPVFMAAEAPPYNPKNFPVPHIIRPVQTGQTMMRT